MHLVGIIFTTKAWCTEPQILSSNKTCYTARFDRRSLLVPYAYNFYVFSRKTFESWIVCCKSASLPRTEGLLLRCTDIVQMWAGSLVERSSVQRACARVMLDGQVKVYLPSASREVIYSGTLKWWLASEMCICTAAEIIGYSLFNGGTAVAQWLRCYATNLKVAGSNPDGVIGIFHWHNPSYRTMALGSTQPLTEMSIRRISWG